MSVGPAGLPGGMIGSPVNIAAGQVAQTGGSQADQTRPIAANQSRRAQAEQHAELVAGVGQTEQDESTADRDADGRRPWEFPPTAKSEQSSLPEDDSLQTPISRDASGERGQTLDLLG